jgi:hypothetical protein
MSGAVDMMSEPVFVIVLFIKHGLLTSCVSAFFRFIAV